MEDAEQSTTPWWKPLSKRDRWALVSFVVLPILLFVVPALLGRPAIDADNLIQNFPLRVLAGRQIASGHLPLLDPLTNAGTPLLGGMNAGAMYPLTVIFAFVPAITAWVFNLIVVYVTAAVGMYALLRWHGLRTWTACAAGFSYAYSGAMIGQMVHLGVIQGFSFLPWLVLLLLAFARRVENMPADQKRSVTIRAVVPWILGTAVLWGLIFLTGEPRGIADAELLTIVVIPCVLVLRTSYWLTTWRTRSAYLVTLLVGFAWGVGLGLIQLLPGWSFINFSQRSELNYRFFGAGSLPVHWAALLFSPDLFGGNGAFGQPGFFVNYNLAEVTGYAGVLALMGLAAFCTHVRARGWKGPDRDFVIYVVLGVVGLFATFGYYTPLGHIYRKIPLFGSTRLQSRNVILVDLMLAVLLGWWFEQLANSPRVRANLKKWSTWIVALPALMVALLSLGLVVWGPQILEHLAVPGNTVRFASTNQLLNVIHLVIAAAAVVVVLLWRHRRSFFKVLVAVLIADLLAFTMFTATGLIGGSGPREPSRSAAQAVFGVKGRFAEVDQGGAHTGVYRALGEPNMNVFTGLASVQGYGALISTIYDNATGTHPQTMLNACHLADGTFAQLRLNGLAISASELSTNTEYVNSVPRTCVPSSSSKVTHRYFGQVLHARLIDLTGDVGNLGDEPISSAPVTLQLLNAAGKPVGPAITKNGGYSISFSISRRYDAAGFKLSSSAPLHIHDAVVYTSSGGPDFQLDTPFQLAIDSSAWRLTSTDQTFSVFHATHLLPKAWLLSASTGTVSDIHSASWGDTWVTVKVSSQQELARSEAYLPGWRATAVNNATGKSVNLTVHRYNLIQSVEVPKGSWTIHFHYHAPYIEVSSAVSAASLALLLGVGGTLLFQRRRRSNSKVRT